MRSRSSRSGAALSSTTDALQQQYSLGGRSRLNSEAKLRCDWGVDRPAAAAGHIADGGNNVATTKMTKATPCGMPWDAIKRWGTRYDRNGPTGHRTTDRFCHGGVCRKDSKYGGTPPPQRTMN